MSLLPEINLNLHEKQTVAATSTANEILYGGAAGGGKSHLMRVFAIIACSFIPGLLVYLFRRKTKHLYKNHVEGPNGFRSLLAPWIACGFAKIVENEIRFWNGSKVFLCHCEHEKNKYDYDGDEMHLLLMDELTHFTESMYTFIRTRVRAVGLPPIPDKFKEMFPGVTFPRIICGTNPGNIGHLWVKKSFIDNCDPLEIRDMPKKDGGMKRQYIPALLEDNPSMLEDDPDYEYKLEGAGSEALVKAKRWGVWDIIEGAYFDCWTKRMILNPFKVPRSWTKFRSFDWGSAHPFSVGWYAVSPGWESPDGVWIPRNAIVKYREWYGCKKGQDNVGLKLVVEEVGKGIISREEAKETDYSVADPSIFSKDGGPSKEKRFRSEGVYFRKAKNDRVAGWDQVRARMKGMDGMPMLYFFSTCKDSIRTIPALQHDETKPEDLNTKQEDHAADELRYACMSDPWEPPKPPEDIDNGENDGYMSDINDESGVDGWRVI